MATAKKSAKKSTAKRPVDSRASAGQTTRSRRAATQQQGPLYVVTADSFLNGSLVPAGRQVVYFGLPGSKLRPVNDEAIDRKKQVSAIRKDPDLDREEKVEQLRALSDEWNGVEADDDWLDGADDGSDEPLSDAERVELEKHAAASVQATRESEQDDTNLTRVKLTGSNNETQASLQGNTPVTDAKGGKS